MSRLELQGNHVKQHHTTIVRIPRAFERADLAARVEAGHGEELADQGFVAGENAWMHEWDRTGDEPEHPAMWATTTRTDSPSPR